MSDNYKVVLVSREDDVQKELNRLVDQGYGLHTIIERDVACGYMLVVEQTSIPVIKIKKQIPSELGPFAKFLMPKSWQNDVVIKRGKE